jgi:hypothetical protein
MEDESMQNNDCFRFNFCSALCVCKDLSDDYIRHVTYHVLHVGSLWSNVGSERVVDVQNGLLVVIRFVCVGAADEENEQDFSQHFP